MKTIDTGNMKPYDIVTWNGHRVRLIERITDAGRPNRKGWKAYNISTAVEICIWDAGLCEHSQQPLVSEVSK